MRSMGDPIEIRVPRPALVVLVGAAGSGKSSFAARHFDPRDVLASDAFRERVSGDPTDQAASRRAFAALHGALRRRLASGRLAVVDATSVARRARTPLVRAAREAGVPALAIVLDLPPDVVLARNAARPGRFAVPDPAVHRQLLSLARSVRHGALGTEGFTAAWILRTPAEVERVRVRVEDG
jgi:predicted kinase